MARRRSGEGSLDLLLDTITNTFGSILFLTMLVALMLRTTVTPTSVDSTSPPQDIGKPLSALEQAQQSARVDELSAEIDVLTNALGAFEPEDPELARLQAAIVAVTNESRQLLQQDAAISGRIAENQRRITEATTEADEIEAAVATARKEATAQAERRRDAERDAAELARSALELDRQADVTGSVQTTITPILEQIPADTKRQVAIYLRYSRLYLMHRWGADGDRLGPNPDHFVIAPRPDGGLSARARPDAGVSVDDTAMRDELAALLQPFPPDRWIVAIVVYEDSFSQFQAVKQAIIGLGYQYEPIPTGPTGLIQDFGGKPRAQ